jgi:hypothetical protein
MASAAFELDPGTATFGTSPQEVSASGATVRCRLLSVAGITPGSIRWSCIGTNNESVAIPTATPSGSPSGQIATFTIPSGSNQAYIIQCEVNGGPDVNGQASTRSSGKFYVLNVASREPIAYFETTESSTSHGTFELIDAINNTAGGGGTGGVAGIGTIAVPGVLRGVVGDATKYAYHVGGFWTLADSGGGSFYWDGASTATDDGGTIIRPTAIAAPDPGRWKRIYNGELQAEWFGARGDGSRTLGDTSGTDDADAIQACIEAAKANGQSVGFDPRRVYKVSQRTGALKTDPVLLCDEAQGLQLDGTGGIKFALGARIKIVGKKSQALVSAKSSLGFRANGIHFDATSVTGMTTLGDGLTWVYANSAARIADAPHLTGDRGKVAFDTDTGLRFVLRAVGTPDTWDPESIDILDTTHTHMWGIGGTEGGDSANVDIEHCAFSGNAGTHVISRGVRFANTLDSAVRTSQFTNLKVGVGGSDSDFGAGYANVIRVRDCTFNRCDSHGIENPRQSWTVESCTFETKTDGSIVDIATTLAGCEGLTVRGCWFGDATAGGTCIDLSAGLLGGSFTGNLVEVTGTGTYCKLAGVTGLHSHGNTLAITTGYNVTSTSDGCELGHDRFSGTTFATGKTNLRNGKILENSGTGVGGMSLGGSNTLSGGPGLSVGTGNTNSGNNTATIGVNNVAAALDSVCVGAAGVSATTCQFVVGGGQVLGSGGSQWSTVILTKVVTNGANQELPNASVATPGIVGTNRHSYSMIATYMASDQGTGPTKSFMAILLVTARRNSTGTMTISGQTMNGLVDADGTGCTVDAIATGGGVSFRFNNTSGVTMNVVCSVSITECAT